MRGKIGKWVEREKTERDEAEHAAGGSKNPDNSRNQIRLRRAGIGDRRLETGTKMVKGKIQPPFSQK